MIWSIKLLNNNIENCQFFFDCIILYEMQKIYVFLIFRNSRFRFTITITMSRSFLLFLNSLQKKYFRNVENFKFYRWNLLVYFVTLKSIFHYRWLISLFELLKNTYVKIYNDYELIWIKMSISITLLFNMKLMSRSMSNSWFQWKSRTKN